MNRTVEKNVLFIIIFSFTLIILMVSSLFIGSVNVSLANILESIKGNASSIDYKIIIKLRIPRILLSVIAGGILSVSGLIYQTTLKTPLAEPYILGVSSGASFGAALTVIISSAFFENQLPFFPLALTGSLFTIFIIYLLTTRENSNLYTLIFTGLSISFLFNAGVTLIFSIIGNKSHDIIMWLFGSLARPLSYQTLLILSILFFIFISICLSLSKTLDIMYLPDDSAITTGISVKNIRTFFFIFTSIYTALIVSLCGVIGFVGLIVPHIARQIFSGKHLYLISGTALLGAILLLISDNIARTFVSLFSNYGMELPVGVVTAIIGAPFFIYLLSYRRIKK